MKVWIIKHKGADWFGNYMPDKEIELSDGTKMYAQLCFYRRKDALSYLNTKKYKEFYEVVGKQ